MQRALTKAVGKQREETAAARAKVDAARERTAGIVKKVLAGKALTKVV
jgi:hypothetical protein